MEQKNKVCSFTELGAGCWSEAFRNTRKTRRINATAAYKYIEYNYVPGMLICFLRRHLLSGLQKSMEHVETTARPYPY